MTEKEALKRRISAMEFAAWELHLFLDSHPGSCEAARKQAEYAMRMDALKKEYEEKYGSLGKNAETTSRWAWVSDPWPWDADDDCPGKERK